MLYTRKGDSGTTKTLHERDKRVAKTSALAEALGSLDEVNSLLGFLKQRCPPDRLKTLHRVQENLFVAQAELAGATGKKIVKREVTAMEKVIDGIEKELPPIKSFFLPGATELGGLLDYARTVARRAERAVWRAVGEAEELGRRAPGPSTMAYLNRLSSLLYALAREANHRAGAKEEAPSYR